MSKLSLFFARRYLFSRTSRSVINLIAGLSALTVAVPVMAMVVLLSVFNGFDELVKSMYKQFDPDLRVTAMRGKFFDRDSLNTKRLSEIEGISAVSFVLEENALFSYRGRQYVGMMRGVDSLYSAVIPIADRVVRGNYALQFGDLDQAVLGQGVAYALNLNLQLVEPLEVYLPRRGVGSSILPIENYRRGSLFAGGIFALDAETDGQYVLVPYEFAARLLDYDSEASALAIKLVPGSDADRLQVQVQDAVGKSFKVQTRYQQKESFYKILQVEKWGIYVIILLVLVLASFSIIGSVVMLIVEKGRDIETLRTLGAPRRLIRRIFVSEGMLVSCLGALVGLVGGVVLCVLQQRFGFVELKGETFLLDVYPVRVAWSDLVGVVITVVGINFTVCWMTVRAMLGKGRPENPLREL